MLVYNLNVIFLERTLLLGFFWPNYFIERCLLLGYYIIPKISCR